MIFVLVFLKSNNIFWWIMTLQGGFAPAYVDDGLVEVVGFRDAWHGLVLLAPKGHGTRLAQVFDQEAGFMFINQLYCPAVGIYTLLFFYQ